MMAALTDVVGPGISPIGGGTPDDPPAGGGQPADLLAEAARALPAVVGDGPVRCADVHTALYVAACRLGVGRDRSHRLRMADEAFDRFTAYLIWAGHAEPSRRESDPVRRWLLWATVAETQRTLTAAAGYWRRRRPHAPDLT
jgi:hypothetical protein